MTSHRRPFAALIAAMMIVAACGGGSGDGDDSASGAIQDDVVVVDPEQVQDAIDDRDGGEDAEPAVASSGDTPAAEDAGAGTDDGAGDADIEVAEAEEDELDNLMNSLTVFNDCLAESGYTLGEGFPGDDSGRTAADFEQDYLAALGACASESGIQDASAAFGESQANLTPEEIEQNNFGIPVFKECMEDLGWTVGELVPDARGALGFGESGTELTPPGGGGFEDFDPEAINGCRIEAEQFVAENFDDGEG